MKILRKLPENISNAQADQSMNKALISLLEEHRGQRKGEAKRARGKRVDAGVIANTEPLDSVESSEEEEMKDDGIISKIC